jgi:DNA processing protein
VISGLARGVDGWAHRGSIDAGGPTVAVLGCGIDRDYPRAHASLAAEVAASGLVVSEYPPGVAPAPWRFPARNRLVAGLAAATVVVEARERSGALITADLALEEGRDVLAVPGEITSALSKGANGLLRLGAGPVTSAADVLEALGVEPPDPPDGDVPGPGASAVLAVLTQGASTADQVARAAGLDPAAVSAALVELELSGIVEARAGIYRRSRDAAT